MSILNGWVTLTHSAPLSYILYGGYKTLLSVDLEETSIFILGTIIRNQNTLFLKKAVAKGSWRDF